MFHKKYRIKTSTTVKGSERRKIKGILETQYTALSEVELNLLIPSKGEMCQVKAIAHNGTQVMIYCCPSNPLFFMVENRCFPTVYTLWNFPKLLPAITTVPFAFEKIRNGADLMAPGIIVNKYTAAEFEGLKENDICSVRISGNKAPVAIGTALMSEKELLEEGRKGKAVMIVHTFKDTLWFSGDQKPLPDIACTSDDVEDDDSFLGNDDIPNEVDISVPDCSALCIDIAPKVVDNDQNPGAEANENESIVEATVHYDMDEILYSCFMTALKVSGKKIQLPILTSTFYKLYVLTCCPSTMNIDVKKTTYKKLSVFLKRMESLGLIHIKELSKGVESIVHMNTEHELLTTYHVDDMFSDHLRSQKAEKMSSDRADCVAKETYKFPDIVEMRTVSAQVHDIFKAFKIKKGDALTLGEINEILREYVKINSLQDDANPREVILDPVLAHCLLKRDESLKSMKREELREAIISKMQHAYQIAYDGEQPVMKRGKLEPIEVTVARRTGNKKVTLIQNLENFGIVPEKLAHDAQVTVAASTSVSPTPNGKGMQVLIQGNQLQYLHKAFAELYKVPKKYINGLENFPRKKEK